MQCHGCGSHSSLVSKEDLGKFGEEFGLYLKRFNLTTLCEKCVTVAFATYKHDIRKFIDWLFLNDNQKAEIPEISSLKVSLGVNEELLEEDPDQYLDNLEKYVVVLETKLLQSSNPHAENI